MDKAKNALEKLQRIQGLWFALEHAKPDAREYVDLIERIHTLSSEYQTLIDSLHKFPPSAK